MPLNTKGRKIKEAMEKEYGKEKGKKVFYASENKGTIKGVTKHKISKPKPQGKGIVKALGQKGTTGNFKKIEAEKGKGAAIAALQNKLAARRGQPIPFKRKKVGEKMLERGMKGYKR